MKIFGERTTAIILLIATLIGGVAFGVALAVVSPLRAWEAYLTNFLFWTGIAQGGIIVSAGLYICQGRWGGSGMYRLAEAWSGFLALSFFLFWPLFAARYWIFPWLVHPIPEKTPYLNIPFLFGRDGACFLVMWLLSWLFVRFSRRREAVEWAEDYESVEEPPVSVRRLAPALPITFAITYYVIAVDLVMSLSPEWYSTMFPLYFTFGAFVTGIMAMGLFAAAGKRPARHDIAGERGGVLHDLGKLVFAGPSFWAYLLFSMYLVIWYGDIPKETFFVAPRVNYAPWGIVGWAALCLIWVVPLLVLLPRAAKQSPIVLGLVSFFGLVGFWMERYVLIAPSLNRYRVPFGWIEALITLGFLGLFGLSSLPGLRLVPSATLKQAREEPA